MLVCWVSFQNNSFLFGGIFDYWFSKGWHRVWEVCWIGCVFTSMYDVINKLTVLRLIIYFLRFFYFHNIFFFSFVSSSCFVLQNRLMIFSFGRFSSLLFLRRRHIFMIVRFRYVVDLANWNFLLNINFVRRLLFLIIRWRMFLNLIRYFFLTLAAAH